MQFYRDFITEAPDDLNGFFAFLRVPPDPLFPTYLHHQTMCGVVWCYTGPVARPLPAAACGLAFTGSVAPQGDQHLQAQAAESLDPGPFGQCTEQTRGQVFIPAPYAAQLGVGATPEERGKHHTDDLAQQFLLAPQTPCDLGDQVFGEPQVLQSLVKGLSGLLRLAAVTGEALLSVAVATLS